MKGEKTRQPKARHEPRVPARCAGSGILTPQTAEGCPLRRGWLECPERALGKASVNLEVGGSAGKWNLLGSADSYPVV